MWQGITAGIGITTLAVLLGINSQWQSPAGSGWTAISGGSGASAQVTGKAVFEGKGNCATCHGKDAKGTPLGPDLTDGEWLGSGTLAGITSAIRQGVARPQKYPAPMPPMGGGRLSSDEVDAVARYVFELAATTRPAE